MLGDLEQLKVDLQTEAQAGAAVASATSHTNVLVSLKSARA
jgi:hypothetical protein